MELKLGVQQLDLSRPRVMGIINATPDSFSDGGQFSDPERALNHALEMQASGADIVDVGGESTRPGAAEVSIEEELQRIIPVIEVLTQHLTIPISIDTSKAQVMQLAIEAGASMINDVRALSSPGALACAARLDVPVCLMHMQGSPQSMQTAPQYRGVLSAVSAFLQSRIDNCEQAGIDRSRLIIDPGFGFGKTLAHNLELLDELEQLKKLGLPILVGLSRKSMLGLITGKNEQQRLASSLGVNMIALQGGANILRVHDVAETVDMVKVWQAMVDNRAENN